MTRPIYKHAWFDRHVKKGLPIFLSIALAGSLPGAAFAKDTSNSSKAKSSDQLSLSEYLNEVAQNHLGYKAALDLSKAARQQAQEGSLLLAPNFFGEGSTGTLGLQNPFSNSNALNSKSYILGLNKTTTFGLSGRFYFTQQDLNKSGIPTYTTESLQLELKQSLWRNFGGTEVRSQIEAIESGAMAKSYAQSFLTKSLLLEAESFYWNLALARKLVSIQKDSVERAQKIYDWTQRRVKLSLSDRAEMLQASTNLQARKLELRNAQDQERAAAQSFNSSRGMLSNQVAETLQVLSSELVATFVTPERNQRREDVLSAEMEARAKEASALANQERNKPTFELFGKTPVSEPSSDAGTNPLANYVATSSQPITLIGLRLNVPLDFDALEKIKEGYAAEANAAHQAFKRKVFEEEKDWQDLTSKFSQAKERLILYEDLVNVQHQKLNHERDRQQRGRSTLQQVLLFETDFEQAQLGHLRTLAEVLLLNAQMKLYGVSYESR